jgi:quercetin dioxygenase-like cupin family protein
VSHLRLLMVTFSVAVLMLTASRAIAAQPATPQAGMGVALPAGVTQQNLAIGSAAPLLPAGAIIELARFTFAPGAVVVLPEASPSLALVYVESGILTVRIEAPVTLTRATSDSSGKLETIPAGTAFTADQSDFFVGPPHVAVEARNDGREPLVLLMAVLGPAAAMGVAATPAP